MAAATKKQVKSALDGAAVKETSVDLKDLSDVELVGYGVSCLEVIAGAERNYQRVLEVLETRFPGEKVTEFITTERGVATRKVTNAWLVKPGKEDHLRKLLGKQYSEWIEEKENVSVVKDKVAELAQKLGAKWQDYFHFSTQLKVLPKLQNAIKSGSDRLATQADRYIDVITKTTVSIQPVDREKKAA